MGIANFGRRDSENYRGDGWTEPSWYETSDGGVVIGTNKRSVKISPKTVRAAVVGGDERALVDAMHDALEKLHDPLYDFDMGPTLAAWERP